MSATTTKNSNSKGNSKSTGKKIITSRPRITAGECPNSPKHENTKVYNTRGRKRYCKCNDCGETWVVTGDYSDPLRQLAMEIADLLEQTDPVEDPNGRVVICIEAKSAQAMAKDLRERAAE